MFCVTPGEYGKLTADPPSVADHPAKVKPVLVGALGSATVPPVVKDPFETDVPPFAVNVTVEVLAVHTGYRVSMASVV
jgi:hypothetical protein